MYICVYEIVVQIVYIVRVRLQIFAHIGMQMCAAGRMSNKTQRKC